MQKTLRELEGKSLTEAQKNAEKLRDIREKRAQAEQAIEQENFEKASELALEAEQLAAEHARNQRQRADEGKAYEFEAIQAKKEFVETAELASTALQKLKDSEQKQAESAAAAAEEQKQKLEQVQQTIVDINAQIAEEKLLKINVNDDQVRAAIERINAIPTSKTVTITTRNVQANQQGGLIHRADGGFIPREGQLPGFGGGDRVKALRRS